MSPRSGPSAGILAAAVSAILFGALLAAVIVFMFFGLYVGRRLGNDPNLPPYAKLLAEIIWGAFFVGAGVLIASGAGAFQLRRWARVAMLVFSGIFLFFGVLGIFVILFVVLATPLPGPATAKIAIIAALVAVYGIPIALGVWWLILFTRPAVIAQFEQRRNEALQLGVPPRTIRFSKQGCPLGVSIVAWFLLSSVATAIILPFLPFPVPVFFFGRLIEGPSAVLVLIAQFGLLAITSIGLLRLQRWSLPAVVILQAFYAVNGLFTFTSSHYTDQLRTVMKKMELPPPPPGVPDFLPYTRYFAWFGLLVPIACIVTLLIQRKAFNAAADAPDLPAPPQPPQTVA